MNTFELIQALGWALNQEKSTAEEIASAHQTYRQAKVWLDTQSLIVDATHEMLRTHYSQYMPNTDLEINCPKQNKP